MHTVDYTITSLHCDCFSRCKPSSLLRFAQEAAEDHCKSLGTDWESMMAKGYFWAVIRQKLEVTRLPMEGEPVTIKTWPMPTTRTSYPRATEGFDRDGNSLFRLISLWVIMDVHTRAMVLPGKSGITVAGTAYGTELKAPSGLPVAQTCHQCSRSVVFSDLDVNSHMNNTRYLDWLFDLLPADFHQAHPLKAATICYMSEAREGQTLSLGWCGSPVFLCHGRREHTDDAQENTLVFSAKLEF